VQSGIATMMPAAQLFASPIRLDKNWKPQPYLAESWTLSPDNRSITLVLRKNAVFHDGKPITAEDVKFSIETIRDNHPFKTMYGPVNAVTINDAQTAVIRLAEPHPAVLLALSTSLTPIIPKHIFGDGTDVKIHPRNANPVGSGAFKLVEFKPQGFRCLSLVHKESTEDAETTWSAYAKQCNSFMAAISNNQPEGTRTDNYYRMTLTLLALSMPYSHRNPKVGDDMLVDISVSAVERMLDKVMMQWHSDEMIERRPLKPNQLPNDKYESYVTKMPTEEELERLKNSNERLVVL
jgi:hypothetical protein